jgi:hypothetical protein
MKNPTLLTALPILIGLPLAMLCSCGDDNANPPAADSDSVVDTPPIDPDVPPATSKYAGTYSFGTDPEKEATGTLLVYPIDDTMALVHLDVQNGSPAHNSGSLTQSVAIIADTAMIWIGTNDDGECKIALHFSGNEVTAQTHANKGCGFGSGVMADHVYTRANGVIPQYYLSGEGDTIRFQQHMENGLAMPAH